jgi:predicted phage terminase large subunit-like protein
MQTENDRYQYSSAEFQYVAFDELSHFLATQYTFLFTRLRRLKGVDIPLRMRSASNPGGIGHDWVKGRFIDPKTRHPGAVFIPAKIADNPSLDEQEYEASLANTDPLTRQQIRDGDWNAVVGGRFQRAWFANNRYRTAHGAVRIGGQAYLWHDLRRKWLTVDPAASVPETSKDDPDYTVISTWAMTPCGRLLWLGCVRVRVEVPDIAPLVAREYERHGCESAVIEAGGTQKGIAQLARRQLLPGSQRYMNVVEYVPANKDKLDRATPALCLAEAGRVSLPETVADAPGPGFPLEEVEAELYRFTGDAKKDSHDDIVDTLSMAAARVMEREPQRTQRISLVPLTSRR